MITQSRLKEVLFYDPETGIFTWKVNKARTAQLGNIAGTKRNNGYIYIRVDDYLTASHRLAWLYVYGEFPTISIDHINRNPSDNKISNLRLVSQSENNVNKGLISRNTSGYIGVRWNPRFGKYVSRISKGGIEYHLGLFSDIELAIKARNEKARELYPRIPEAITIRIKK